MTTHTVQLLVRDFGSAAALDRFNLLADEEMRGNTNRTTIL
jgi:hypothetical protein